MRVARRETRQAAIDAIVFGTGMVFFPALGDDSDVKCIRPWEYKLLKGDDDETVKR